MKNINLKIFIIAIFLLSFSAFSQDSLAVKSKCESLKAKYEAKLAAWKKISISMNNKELTKTKYDELLPIYDGLWKESCEIQKKWFICKADTTKIKAISFEPPPPPPPPPINNEEEIIDIFDTGKTIPILSEESKNKLYDYITLNYPAQALKDSFSGVVIIKFICTKEGIAENISVVSQNPDNFGFGEVAVEAIKQVRFKPGLDSRKKPYKVRMNYKIIFEPPKKEK